MEVKLISKGQLSCIHALITKLNLKERKADIVRGFSGERTSTSSYMYMHEATDMIRYLKSLDPEEQANEKMRRYIISMAHECGYRIPGTTKVDMKRLDGWCKEFGKYKKTLNRHNHKELVELVTQFKERYKSHLRSI
ncbi:MAG: hypothetical protein ACK4EY_15225 [Flavipsychrobacter sp.]